MSARDSVEKDYYAVLGVAKDASAADVKKAYRKLARDHHPDTNPEGEARFKAVSEAYDVLSDDDKRREYDEQRSLFGSGRGAGTPFEAEYRLREAATGEYRWFFARAVPLRDGAGDVVRWFGTCTDIDDAKRAERALTEQGAARDAALAG